MVQVMKGYKDELRVRFASLLFSLSLKILVFAHHFFSLCRKPFASSKISCWRSARCEGKISSHFHFGFLTVAGFFILFEQLNEAKEEIRTLKALHDKDSMLDMKILAEQLSNRPDDEDDDDDDDELVREVLKGY